MIKFDNRCTGCKACIQSCPKSCIKTKIHGLGFEYPDIDESTCIHCDLCSRICPIEHEIVTPATQKAYAVVHKNAVTVNQSTSGGMFSAVAEWVLKNNGVVYGCAFDDVLHAKTIRVDDSAILGRLRGSKYVQCDTGDSFASTEKDLKTGRTVFFTGTPCQIDGLKSFLKIDYDNLICADLICHGVPSSRYFLDYIAYLEKKNNGKVKDFSFRSKQNCSGSYVARYDYISNNTKQKHQKRLCYYNSYYYSYFLYGEISRESCYTCKYANLKRVGDLTFGDLWGVEGIHIPFKTNNGCSLVIVNSVKGQYIFDSVQIKHHEIPIEVAVCNNLQLKQPTVRTDKRTERESEYKNITSFIIAKKFYKQNWMSILLGTVKYAIPKGVKIMLLKARYSNRTHADNKNMRK